MHSFGIQRSLLAGVVVSLAFALAACSVEDPKAPNATAPTETTTALSVSAPPDKTVEANGALSAVDIGLASFANGAPPVTLRHNAPQQFPLGATHVTWTATDANNATASKVQKITVVDTTKPNLIAPANIVARPTGTLTSVNLGNPTVSDTVDAAPAVSHDAPSGFPQGTTTVTWKATDKSGNTATATQTVTISMAFVLSAPPDRRVEATAPTTVVALGTATTMNGVGSVTITNNAPAAGFPVGATRVTWTARDSGGNSATAEQFVTITDTTAPRVTPPPTVQATASAATTQVNLGQGSASDLVDGAITPTHNAPAAGFPVGTTAVTWTARDQAGNVGTAVQQVIISAAPSDNCTSLQSSFTQNVLPVLVNQCSACHRPNGSAKSFNVVASDPVASFESFKTTAAKRDRNGASIMLSKPLNSLGDHPGGQIFSGTSDPGYTAVAKMVSDVEKCAPSSGPPPSTNPFACSSPDLQAVSSLQRLTRTQYSNTLLNLIGTTLHAQVQPLIDGMADDTIRKKVSDYSPLISDAQMTAYQAVAEKVYTLVQGDSAAAAALGGACINASPVTASCRDQFIGNIGLKAFRRPLSTAEVQKFAQSAFDLGRSGAEGVGLTLYAMLMAPDLLLHLELGATNDTSTAASFALTPYEVAARISYGLTDSPPDSALLAAAAQNQLSTEAQVGAQVDRLMNTSAAKRKILTFFAYYLDPRYYPASAYYADFLAGLDVRAANAEFEREMYEYLDYMLFTKKASFYDLMTSRESFARTAAVANIYGHAPVSGNTPAQTATSRIGLLMRTPVISTEGAETHPILRGAKIQSRFLCETVGLPVGVLVTDSSFFTDTARTQMSTRQRTTGLTADASCMACHTKINAAGFVFENLDGLGRVRSMEAAYSLNGRFLANHPIDTRVSGVALGGAAVADFSDGTDLVRKLAQGSSLPACFVTQTRRYYQLRDDRADDSCVQNQLYAALVGSNNAAPVVEVFKKQIVNRSLFTRRMR